MKSITLLIILLSVICIAEENISKSEPKDTEERSYSTITQKRYSNYLGIAAGLTTGYGISYRKWIKNSWGFQINLLPFYREKKYDGDDFNSYDRDSGFYDTGDLSLGLTFLKKISDAKYIRFLFYSGANLHTTYEKYDYYDTRSVWSSPHNTYIDSVVHRSGKDIENKISIGVGAGCEWYVWRFAFHCMVGLMGAYAIEPKSYEVGPSIEGGIHFRF